uniref:AT-rich interactive domain-containing protein 5B n=1 Tax=Lepisosteus oculatus TaxID=7918 RepID=W5MIL2_LEPOC|nr:PREDICTED: AT-rich interactive domain-containing protein 5B [Lepisosteus oculatus]
MEPNSLKWVGSPCGLHGPYVFYKAFKFHLEGKPRILSLGDFFFVRCKPGDPICIAELQLLWEERTTKQLLSSSKLYFLPEDTPQGRTVRHGEDEIIAASEKVIVKLDNLVKWTSSDFSEWSCGLKAVPLKPSIQKELGRIGQREALQKYRESTLNSGLNFKDVLKEKAELGEDDEEKNVLVLSYPQYCRYRSMVARLRERPSSLLTDHVVLALGGIASLNNNTRILYCRDTFEHPTLIENESICDEFAPNLKGRPRKKKPSTSQRRDSQVLNGVRESSSAGEGKASAKVKTESKAVVAKPKNSSNCKKVAAEEKPQLGAGEECRADEQAFLVALYKYMKERKTPIERIPYLGFKQINLWTMFQAAQKLGGYELITARRQWKNVYDELGGNPGSTSAATCTRRHYERLILPYERHIKGEEDKPLPPVKPRRPESSSQEGGCKTKVATAKRLKGEPNQKPRNEKDVSQRNLGVPDSKEGFPEMADVKPVHQPQQQHSLMKEEVKDEEEELGLSAEEQNLEHKTKEDAAGCNTLLNMSAPSEKPPSERASSDAAVPSPPTAITVATPEQCGHGLLDKLSNELQEKAASGFTVAAPQLLHVSHMQDQRQKCVPEYSTPCVVGKVDPSVHKETPNQVGMVLPTLKQQPPQAPTAPENIPEQDLPDKEDSCISYTPILYPRANPGIMSPLAKKKLLSQVSGTALPNNYSFGPPPPLIKKGMNNNADDLAALHNSQVSSAETIVISRPSVIQHAQSFKIRNAEERKPLGEPLKHDLLGKCEAFPCDLSKSQQSSAGETSTERTDAHDTVDKTSEKWTAPLSQLPHFLTEFYSSPHLHSLYRQTEHHLNKEQLSKYLNRESLFSREHENISCFTPTQHSDNIGLSYCSPLSQKEKLTSAKISSDDQPTDLSLPKSSAHKLPSSKPSPCGVPQSAMQQDRKSPPLFQVAVSQASSHDCNPKACRVPPMTMSTPKKAADPPQRAPGTTQNGRAEDVVVHKMDEIARPILSVKSSPQNIGAARPLKRNLEELETGAPEKKIRAVTPMHAVKETTGKAHMSEQDSEGGKPVESAHAVHANSFLDSHKLPLHSPIFPGLYPGAFVSQVQDMCDSLGSHIPTGYSHSLQYLKNHAVISPLMPPFAIHSFMMQRQLLASSPNPPQIYRHLTSTAPVGTSYGDLLHHSLYPLSALNPQPAFSPSQLSSVHPSTKL